MLELHSNILGAGFSFVSLPVSPRLSLIKLVLSPFKLMRIDERSCKVYSPMHNKKPGISNYERTTFQTTNYRSG